MWNANKPSHSLLLLLKHGVEMIIPAPVTEEFQITLEVETKASI